MKSLGLKILNKYRLGKLTKPEYNWGFIISYLEETNNPKLLEKISKKFD